MEACSHCHKNKELREMVRNANICKICKREYNSITNKYPTCKNSKRIYKMYGKYKNKLGSQKIISHCNQEVFNYFISKQKRFYYNYYSYLYSPDFLYVYDHIVPLLLFKNPNLAYIGCHWLNIRVVPSQVNRKKGIKVGIESIQLLLLNLRLAHLFGIEVSNYDLICLTYLIEMCLAIISYRTNIEDNKHY